MKKFFGLGFLVGFFASVVVFAQAAVPAPAPSVMEVILKALDLVHSWKMVGVWGGIAIALKLLIDGTKAIGWFDKVPQALQSSFVLLVGALTVGLGVLADKGTVQMALVATVSSSAFAMLVHEWSDDVLGWIKLKLQSKVSPPPSN